MILPFNTPQDDFERFVLTAESPDAVASGIISLCKKWDLREPSCADIVRRIAESHDSDHGWLRHAVMFSLCFFRPVPGYEWVLADGWRRADPGDLHWYASGIEITIDRKDLITPEMVEVIGARLNNPTPTEDQFDSGKYEYFGEAWMDRVWEVDETLRALRYLELLLSATRVEIKDWRETQVARFRETRDSSAVSAEQLGREVRDGRSLAERLLRLIASH